MPVLAAFALSLQAATALCLEHPLAHGRSAVFRSGSSRVARIDFAGDAVLEATLDPQCPAPSSLRIFTEADRVVSLDLPCGNWRKTRKGFHYIGQSGSAVRRIVLSGDKLKIRLGTITAEALVGPLPFAEVGLTIGADTYCGRFTTATANATGFASFLGPTQGCHLPLPNFIVVVVDDVRFDGIDRMPVLAQIAGEGVSFDNAFTPNAVCAPSRASILSGLYSLRHGTFHVSGPLGGAHRFREAGLDQQALPVWLHDAGYRTGLFGKYINGYGSTEAMQGPGGTFYIPPGWDRWWAIMSAEHYGGVVGGTYHVVEENAAITTYADHTTDAEYSTDLSAEQLRSFIAGAVTGGQRFFAYWAPYAAHGEWPLLLAAPAERHLGMFESLLPWRPPSYNEADVSDKPRWVQTVKALLSDPFKGALLRQITDLFRISQYQALLAVDEQIGLILQQLTSLGVLRDTVILFTSDNGVGWGEHQTFTGKESPYEESQRVPMLVYYPRRFGPGPRHVAAPVLNLDIAPTIAALAEVSPTLEPDGADMRALLDGSPNPPWRTDYLLERWRAARGDSLLYTGQVADGDRIRLFVGDPRAKPRASLVFEFDSNNGVSADAIAVPIGPTADLTFAGLRNQIAANVPGSQVALNSASGKLVVNLPAADERMSVIFWEEVDQLGSIQASDVPPDYLGVRDLANGFTWVENETGERELYDLNVDPDQLLNRADDPAYAGVRSQLEQRLADLLEEIESRSP